MKLTIEIEDYVLFSTQRIDPQVLDVVVNELLDSLRAKFRLKTPPGTLPEFGGSFVRDGNVVGFWECK